jgi:triacylglycerol lipase
MPQDLTAIAQAVRNLGRRFEPDVIMKSHALYTPLHETEPYAGVAVTRDLKYGEHERHRLDVFAPQERTAARAVLVYVHGGGFIGGDKKTRNSPYHDNIGAWAVRHGLIGVNMTYRLAPQFPWPAGAEDVAAAVAWVKRAISLHSGDPGRIFLMGSSAGAAHVASYLALPRFGDAQREIKGAILLSGIYDPALFERNDLLTSYFGVDTTRYAERSSLPCLVATRVPLLVTLAEFDPIDFERQALALVDAFFERHRQWPNFVRLMGHNHFTTSLQLNTADDYLGRQVLAFMAGNTR